MKLEMKLEARKDNTSGFWMASSYVVLTGCVSGHNTQMEIRRNQLGIFK